MESPSLKTQLPPIPAKRYFTIGEVSDLCGVKPHVLRYWEQEFTQLKPVKRRGNRRYYQHHEVLLIRRIRELLYDQGFTISGARNRLDEMSSDGGRIVRTRATDLIPPPATPSSGMPTAAPAVVAAAPKAVAAKSGTAAGTAAGIAKAEIVRKEIKGVLELLRA
jgi:DNA-binding transcriptional MerR regulator